MKIQLSAICLDLYIKLLKWLLILYFDALQILISQPTIIDYSCTTVTLSDNNYTVNMPA